MAEPGIEAQIEQVWVGVMQQTTAAGASRNDIIMMTARTVESILGVTADQLWGSETPSGENMAREVFGKVQHTLADFRMSREPVEGQEALPEVPVNVDPQEP